MSFIGRFANSDWQGGLASMFGGTGGAAIVDTAMGRQSIGQMASNLGKEVAIQVPIAIATMGVGAAAGAAASGITKVASGAIQAGTTAGKIAAGTAKALNTVAGSLGTIKGTFGGNGVKGVAKGAGQTIGNTLTNGLINPQSIKTVGGKLVTSFKGVPTGEAAPVPIEPTSIAKPTQTVQVGAGINPNAAKVNTQGSGQVVGTEAPVVGTEAPVLRPKAKISLLDRASTNLNNFGKDHPLMAKAGAGAKKVAGKIGVSDAIQGGMALATGIQGASQASASNKIQTQSLLFQKQTYNEAKAKEESTKAQLKSDAWNAYSSASLFGETLYGSESNSTLLTSYNTNGTGNQGVFSLLNTGVTTRRSENLT